MSRRPSGFRDSSCFLPILRPQPLGFPWAPSSTSLARSAMGSSSGMSVPARLGQQWLPSWDPSGPPRGLVPRARRTAPAREADWSRARGGLLLRARRTAPAREADCSCARGGLVGACGPFARRSGPVRPTNWSCRSGGLVCVADWFASSSHCSVSVTMRVTACAGRESCAVATFGVAIRPSTGVTCERS
jgi:hypothetical protein